MLRIFPPRDGKMLTPSSADLYWLGVINWTLGHEDLGETQRIVCNKWKQHSKLDVHGFSMDFPY